MKKPDPYQFNDIQPIPGLLLRARAENIEIRSIPALSAIAGSIVESAAPTDCTYSPARTLYVTQNEDGSYAVLNRLELIKADIARIAAKWVTAHVVELVPGQDEPISLFRTFLTTVEPARRCISGPQLLTEIYDGRLEKLASSYQSTRCKPGAWGMYRRLFSNNELPKSTFYAPRSVRATNGGTVTDTPEPNDASACATDDDTAGTTPPHEPNAHRDSELEPDREDQSSARDTTPAPHIGGKNTKGKQRDLFEKPEKPDKPD